MLCATSHVLDVKYEVTPERVYFKYSLHTAIQSKMFQSVQPGGIDVDSGDLTVTSRRLEATKAVRFTELSALEGAQSVPAFVAAPFNSIAPAMVSLALHEGVLHALAKYVRPLPGKETANA